MEDAESTERDKDNINKDKTKEETVMDTSELYQISDGDTGKQVADGLKQNFDVLGAAIPDDNTILEKSGYRVDMAALMRDSPASATISDAIGGWENLVAAINAKMVIIGYKEGVSTTAVHAEIVESTKIILAVNSETTAIKFNITNTSGTLGCSREETVLQTASDESLNTKDKTIVGAINEVHDAIGDGMDGLVLLNRDLGKYDTSISLPMTVEKSGKYVDPDGQEKSSASMGISAPLEVKSGNIYLLQCAAAVGTGVALFSRKVTNTYDKVIAYSYTYNGDGTIATATADYNPELVYSYSYIEEGVATITDKDGETVPELPATHQVTESFYEPLFRTNDATMPKSGYYLLLCTQDMEIVMSAASSDITGKNLLGVRYGVFASIATNFVGSPGQKVIAQAFAELYAAVQALSSVVDNAGHLKADVLDMANLPKVCGEDMYLTGEGAPAAPPTVPFQEYYDSSNNKFYRAKGVLPDTPSTGDWVALN